MLVASVSSRLLLLRSDMHIGGEGDEQQQQNEVIKEREMEEMPKQRTDGQLCYKVGSPL